LIADGGGRRHGADRRAGTILGTVAGIFSCARSGNGIVLVGVPGSRYNIFVGAIILGMLVLHVACRKPLSAEAWPPKSSGSADQQVVRLRSAPLVTLAHLARRRGGGALGDMGRPRPP